MKRITLISSTFLLVLAIGTTTIAGNISTIKAGNISTSKPGNISTDYTGNISTLKPVTTTATTTGSGTSLTDQVELTYYLLGIVSVML